MFDRIMEKHVDEMEQIVIPGAGFDLIALHYTKGKKVTEFNLFGEKLDIEPFYCIVEAEKT
jgi:hypothetical protein